MLKYNELKRRPSEFLAATGFKAAEFEQLLAAFREAERKVYPPGLTQAGSVRQRESGGWRQRSSVRERRQTLVYSRLPEDQSAANDAGSAI